MELPQLTQKVSDFNSRKFKFWSFLSMFLLVFVHGYNLHERYMQPWTMPGEALNFTTFTEYFLANGIFRFRIPMLFIISGFLFAMHDYRPYGQRTKKRLRTLLLPYLIWSAMGFAFTYFLEIFPYTREIVTSSNIVRIDDSRALLHDYHWYEMLGRWILIPVPYQLWFIRVLLIYNTYLWSTGAATQKIVVDTTGKYWVKVTNGSRTASDTVLTFVSYKLPNIETRFGRMLIWLYPQTPLHRHNFIKLVAEKFYDSLLFHRVIHGFVIQGGDPLGTGYGGTGYTIPAEFRAALTHVNGAVGAARDNNPAKASNGSQFYIVNNPAGTHSLDGNYTVFGQVISGISVVDSISLVPTNPANNRPLTNVYMDNIRFVYFTASELKNNFGFSITK